MSISRENIVIKKEVLPMYNRMTATINTGAVVMVSKDIDNQVDVIEVATKQLTSVLDYTLYGEVRHKLKDLRLYLSHNPHIDYHTAQTMFDELFDAARIQP